MRTTLTIDDDLAGILQRKSRELDLPFKQVVNTALRIGLAKNSQIEKPRIVVRPHDFGANLFPNMVQPNQLIDELEIEDYLRKAAKDDSARP